MEILETEGYALSLEKLLIYSESRFTIVSQIYCFLKKSRSKSFVIRIPFGLEYNVIRNFFIYLDPLQLDSRETRRISYPTTTFILKRTRTISFLTLISARKIHFFPLGSPLNRRTLEFSITRCTKRDLKSIWKSEVGGKQRVAVKYGFESNAFVRLLREMRFRCV